MHKNPVVYQIYPKSFKDSDGDGWGDIQGIIEKLDYLHDLGVDLVWLTPIFTSPQRDNGYDVAHYTEINDRYGTMEDVDRLIFEAKKRNIGIMFDMVFNHTSTSHEWFQKALVDPTYRDYYIFKEKPTNWISKFGGNAWKYVDSLDAYYLHLFDETQADLNWENEAVFKELVRICNFWLEKGIKGFRFDVINLISKPEVFEDDFEGDGRRFYTDGPKVHQYLKKLNQASFGRYEDVITVGELSSTSIENGVKYADPKEHELSTVFNFHHLKVDYKDGDKWSLKPFDFLEYKHLMATWQEAMQKSGATMSLFLNNHDQPRAISRFGDDEKYPYESATLLATVTFLMKGMPYIYQGEEIGLPNAYFTELSEYRDIESLNYYEILRRSLTHEEAMHILRQRSRDNGRTPMPWDNSHHHGFTTGEPWLPLSKSHNLKSVEDNLQDPGSVLNYYKKLLKLRKENDVFQEGSIEFLEQLHPKIMHYHRHLDDQTYGVLGNFYGENVLLNIGVLANDIILSNYEIHETLIRLKPYQVVVYRKRKMD